MTLPQTSNDPDGFGCYSDHGTDIAYYGVCTMCGSNDPDVVAHVLPGTERLKGVDPIAASQAVMDEHSMKFVDDVLLDLQTANCITTIYKAMSKENQAKLRKMNITKAGTVCWKLANR